MTITLPEKTQKQLLELASRRSISLQELVGQIIDSYLLSTNEESRELSDWQFLGREALDLIEQDP